MMMIGLNSVFECIGKREMNSTGVRKVIPFGQYVNGIAALS